MAVRTGSVERIRTVLSKHGPTCTIGQAREMYGEDLDTSIFYAERKKLREANKKPAAKQSVKNGRPEVTTAEHVLNVLKRRKKPLSAQEIDAEMTVMKDEGKWETTSEKTIDLIYQTLSAMKKKDLVLTEMVDNRSFYSLGPAALPAKEVVPAVASSNGEQESAKEREQKPGTIRVQEPEQSQGTSLLVGIIKVQDSDGVLALVEAGKYLIAGMGGKERAKQLIDKLG